MASSPVPIIGATGALGFGLALRLAQADVPVVIGSRRQESFRAQSENLTNLKEVLEPGQILVDATVPLAAAVSGRATRLLGVPQGSAAEQAQEMAPDGVRVVSAFHTVGASTLGDLDQELDEDVLIAGDEKDAKRELAALVQRIPGLRPVDCGRLEMARMIEGLTPLLISVNSRHKAHAGVRLTGLPDSLW